MRRRLRRGARCVRRQLRQTRRGGRVGVRDRRRRGGRRPRGRLGRRARTRPWRSDTLVDFYSAGKAMVALLALRAVDAGLVGLDDPIATVWPEFAAHGKEAATVRHALCHRAAVPAIGPRLTND
ncbi:MAG TPA: serine hydrolase domain-containing protein, partial [Acidimicrobiia bacterium]